MSNTFSASISEWVRKSEARIEAVVKASAQDIAAEVVKPIAKGGRMRVDTGFLRNSLMASTSSMPRINPKARPGENSAYGDPSGEIALVIAGAAAGEPIYLGFTASYARHREFGANGQPGDAFVRTAAAKWQEIVNRNARALQDRVSSRSR
jgi:hypothetical protein